MDGWHISGSTPSATHTKLSRRAETEHVCVLCYRKHERKQNKNPLEIQRLCVPEAWRHLEAEASAGVRGQRGYRRIISEHKIAVTLLSLSLSLHRGGSSRAASMLPCSRKRSSRSVSTSATQIKIASGPPFPSNLTRRRRFVACNRTEIKAGMQAHA